MTSVADSVGIRSHGIAGATLATLDLAGAGSSMMTMMKRTVSAALFQLDAGRPASLGRWLVEKGRSDQVGRVRRVVVIARGP
jgi:hypothetical protein